jgi:hypothetical protein
MRGFGRIFALLLAASSSACGLVDDAFDPKVDLPDVEEPFAPSSDTVRIGGSDLYLSGGSSAASMPTPSTSASAPKLISTSAVQTGDHSYAITFEVESASDIAYIYLDFGGSGVYRAKPLLKPTESTSADPPLTICGVAASSQGITCSKACLSACSCLQCSSDSTETNAEQACALNCSIYAQNGLLAGSPYNGSEANFASMLYNGTAGVPGFAAQTGCSASACKTASTSTPATSQRRSLQLSFQTPEIPSATPMFAPQFVTADPAPVNSPVAAPATVKVCPLTTEFCR